MRRTSILLAAVTTTLGLGLAACGAAPPLGYTGNRTQWTVPLVHPEQRELVVSATVQGKGPYLFVIDPDAARSVIDDRVARQLDLYSDNHYVRVVNQLDVSMPRKFYEVLKLDAGDLHIRNVKMLNAPAGSLRAGGQVVQGILGSDLVSRTIVVGVDRDAGLLNLALTGHQEVREASSRVEGWLYRGLFYVPMRVGDRTLTMQVRLASSVSTIRPRALDGLGLRGMPAGAMQVDATGTVAHLRGAGVADQVELDGITLRNVPFYRNVDDREDLQFNYDGILGQDILSRFDITLDRDSKVLYLAPRSPARGGAAPGATEG